MIVQYLSKRNSIVYKKQEDHFMITVESIYYIIAIVCGIVYKVYKFGCKQGYEQGYKHGYEQGKNAKK